ncbi:MAG TPA: hypothetical protein GXX19_13015 [Syntrophomonadaceae bacterium]|nr:hypothetical protein [Syntrophomonadaceae bacterium]
MGNDCINRIVGKKFLPGRLVKESTEAAGRLIDKLIMQYDSGIWGNLNVEFLRIAKEQVVVCLQNMGNVAKITVLAPLGIWGITSCYGFPDLDIRELGIGSHRYFLFHSALGLVVLRYLYNKWRNGVSQGSAGWVQIGLQKAGGVLLGASAFGVGVHLMVDVFQPKAVIFPFFGSLLDGTMIDDNIWLLGNSLWAFKIGADLFSLCLADEFKMAKEWTQKYFGGVKDAALYSRY